LLLLPAILHVRHAQGSPFASFIPISNVDLLTFAEVAEIGADFAVCHENGEFVNSETQVSPL
jgi:hypothetical protein